MRIKFKRDTAFRKTFFVPDSFSHPAKMDAQLLLWIVQKYSSPGETILDPMAGIGTTMLACTLGRNVVLVELEYKFCMMMRDNWEQVKMRPQLGSSMGECQIIQGDARQLEGYVDKIVTSPPFGSAEFNYKHGMKETTKNFKGRKVWDEHFQQQTSKDNIGNLPYGQIDKIITSPPYEGMLHGQDHDNPSQAIVDKKGLPQQYADDIKDPQQIGNLKSQSYLEAMLQVYQQCYKVLKPNGLMILVTKNFIRNKQVVRLDDDTVKLCEQAGFNFVERHERVLPSQSFWRVIYHQRHPEVEQIKNEDILVFRK